MAIAIWRLDVSSFFDLHLSINNVNDSRDLSLSIDVDRINTSQSSDLSTFGVVPVLDLQAGGTSWSVREAKGKIQGVGASVSGLGAYARVTGLMTFSTRTLETSRTYQEMKTSYGFSAGISGFWSWIGLGANASYHKEELTQVFNELSQSTKTNGTINIDLYVTGLYPNVTVSASPYILALEVSSKTDSSLKFPVISSGAPTQDTGSQDQNGQNLPTKDNNSTIDI
ncbi:hypothetical protein H6G54_15330 [Anabaena cylindrica FACHB-243]|uniref:Uncharacterized protein n=1 Tax=Anabaena cylindrica (strain ATCC 27899 / PCC 7122) TaxID=272123 RepID=K9ZIL9_ANACC|nr:MULTISPECIES: hypothetical protein [Anabaena]AFZ58180.1 hypothetical protein Anacy_2745 [Anabaena cylindrica PCC 7122]MBD2419044.1 hypothetical protein [Anabaena cylindrica FACHB-243]MCM2409512.1 hypothetical protein [Anabaena sp. CCAP 1446/1C]BAY04847.1 hypothetical protein NIES19_41140 [Anabaena cylindrica PCC 7122]